MCGPLHRKRLTFRFAAPAFINVVMQPDLLGPWISIGTGESQEGFLVRQEKGVGEVDHIICRWFECFRMRLETPLASVPTQQTEGEAIIELRISHAPG